MISKGHVCFRLIKQDFKRLIGSIVGSTWEPGLLEKKARKFGLTVDIWGPVIYCTALPNVMDKLKDELKNVTSKSQFQDLCKKYKGAQKNVLKRCGVLEKVQ